MHNRRIVFWKRSRKARRSLCYSYRRSTSATFRWIHLFRQSCSSPAGKTPCSGGSRTAESTFWLCLCDSCLVVRLQNGVCRVFCSQRCCTRFPWNPAMRLGVHKMFLRLVLVHPVVNFANSLSSVTRGNLGDWCKLWYNSSFVFMHTAFSIQIASQCVAENDCVWSCLIEVQSFLLSEF